MKITKFVTVAAMLLTASAGLAQTETVHVWQDPNRWWVSHFEFKSTVPERFTANEFNLDIFGSLTGGETKFNEVFETSIRHENGTWGGGIGLNYFLSKAFGLGVDANAADNGGHFVDIVSASLIARLPSESTGLAPYIFGGGGRTTDQFWEWTGHAGLGLEWRWNAVTGIFVDGRYIWVNDFNDAVLLRAGLRLIF